MHVSLPEFHLIDQEIECSAQILLEHAPLAVPKRLVYRFPAQYAENISHRGDAFVAALLPLAMHLKEDIIYEGVISARLLHGIGEWIQILAGWKPSLFTAIHVHVGGVVIAEQNPQGKVISAFSGRVDSLFTLYHHTAPQENHPENRISHVVFMHGFDIPLSNRDEFDGWVERFTPQLQSMGITLIPCRTNAQAFATGIVNWVYAHGTALIAAGLLLEPMCREFLISSSWRIWNLRPWGSSIVLDHFLSTEAELICHYGVHCGRMGKLQTIAGWEPSTRLMRVCIDPKHSAPGMNCSHCEKCRRTQFMLHLLGQMDRYETFHQPFLLRSMLTWVTTNTLYLHDTWNFCLRERQYRYLPLLVWVILLYYANKLIRALIPRWLFKRLKRQVYPLEANPFFTTNLPEEWRR